MSDQKINTFMDQSQAIIEIKDLTKRYGSFTAVSHLSLQIYRGDVFGFIGPNGAGKTSTLRIIATLLLPTMGDVFVCGNSVVDSPRQVRRLIGYMPDFFGIYADVSVWEYLDFFAGCFEIEINKRQQLIPELLELVDLTHRSRDPVEKLSRGLKQRLSLARTLIHDPQVLILDEPASGLDPRARVEIRELLRELGKMGKTVFFSSHILSDVSEICTQIGIIEAGELVASGSPAQLHKQMFQTHQLQISVIDEPASVEYFFTGFPGIIRYQKTRHVDSILTYELEFAGDLLETSGLLAEMIKHDLHVIGFTETQTSLEEVFLKATRGLVS
jgi:ABC-2 type transport system ATP-binding protein